MINNQMVTGILVDHHVSLSWHEVCQVYQVDEHQLEELLAYGLIATIQAPSKDLHFDLTMLGRLQRALRLQHDLELNVSGSVLVLELQDKIDELQAQLHILQHHVQDEV